MLNPHLLAPSCFEEGSRKNAKVPGGDGQVVLDVRPARSLFATFSVEFSHLSWEQIKVGILAHREHDASSWQVSSLRLQLR